MKKGGGRLRLDEGFQDARGFCGGGFRPVCWLMILLDDGGVR